MTNGCDLIATERRRQIEAEGWTPEHDDAHNDGSLWRVAVCYAIHPKQRHTGRYMRFPPSLWPKSWDKRWWKPTPDDRIRELVKAGALIAAEIDRLQRASPSPDEGAGVADAGASERSHGPRAGWAPHSAT